MRLIWDYLFIYLFIFPTWDLATEASSARTFSSLNIRQFSSTLSMRFLDACNMCPTKNPITKIPTDVDMAVQGGSASSLYLQSHTQSSSPWHDTSSMFQTEKQQLPKSTNMKLLYIHTKEVGIYKIYAHLHRISCLRWGSPKSSELTYVFSDLETFVCPYMTSGHNSFVIS